MELMDPKLGGWKEPNQAAKVDYIFQKASVNLETVTFKKATSLKLRVNEQFLFFFCSPKGSEQKQLSTFSKDFGVKSSHWK